MARQKRQTKGSVHYVNNKEFTAAIIKHNEACTAWLNIRDNDRIDIKSSKQVFEESKQMMDSLMRKRFEQQDMDFRDELDQVLDEFEEEQYLPRPEDDGPGPDDTVH